METLSCHSNQSIYATAIKNDNFVEANTINISAKFQFIPHIAFEELIFLYFSQTKPSRCHDNHLDKKYMFGRGPLSTNISKKLVKISAMK